ncbi:CorA metal ion transporter, partial [Coemansia sp. RSA 2618]
MGKSKRKAGSKGTSRRHRPRAVPDPATNSPPIHEAHNHPSSLHRSCSHLSSARTPAHWERSGSDSIASRHRRSEDVPSLASAIMHYMPEIDAEDNTDMLASQYYGNMAVLPTDADRHPLPMNSTLPLFSRSIVNTRIDGRARLPSRASDGSLQRARRPRTGSAGARVEVGEDEGVGPRIRRTLSAARHSADAGRGSMAPAVIGDAVGVEQRAQSRGDGREETVDKPSSAVLPENHKVPLARQTPTSSHEESTHKESIHDESTRDKSIHAESIGRHTPASNHEEPIERRASTSNHEEPLGRQESTNSHEESIERRASTGNCGEVVTDEKGGLGLNVSSRPSSHLARRTAHMGATQYKPAARMNAIARAAPGLSYMFSPTVGSVSSSRPPSIMGSATPGHHPVHHVQSQTVLPTRVSSALTEMQRAESQQPQVPGNSDTVVDSAELRQGSDETQGRRVAADETQGGNLGTQETTPRPERKTYGSINIGTLEQFLEEGKVPDTSSDDELSSSDFGWEEDYYSGSEASSLPRRPISAAFMSPPPPHQNIQSRYASADERDASVSSQRPQALMGNQASPHIRSGIERPATPDEHMLLLGHAKKAYGAEYIVPADLPLASELGRAPFTNGSSVRPSPELPSRHRSHHRRRQRNHEELFLDKNGFIDESYRFTFFNPAVGTIRAQEIADLRTPSMDLAELLQVGGCFWIDVLRPSFQEMHLLSKIFGIHALTVEDVMTQDAREKCEIHANYYFVCFRSFDNDPNSESYLEPKCVYSVVLREGIITFHMEPSVHQYHVLRRIRRQIDHIVVTPDWLNYAIIDDVTDLLAPILHRVEFDVDAIDELVLVISSSEQSDMLLRISTVRKRIMMAMRLLQGKADVVRALIKRFESATAFSTTQITAFPGHLAERPGVPATMWSESPRRNGSDPAQRVGELSDAVLDQRKGHEIVLYLGDVLDHIVTMMQNATHYDNMLGRAQTNYLAQISIELTESSNYTNDVVAKLSALAAIVVPLNFITGMWGANVKVPGQDYDDLHYFFYILG